MIWLKHVCESEYACYIDCMKYFLTALFCSALTTIDVSAGGIGIRAGSGYGHYYGSVTSPRAYVVDHVKRRVGHPHRYKKWRRNYGHYPHRSHSGYGWQQQHSAHYPYAQTYYSSPNVIVRKTVKTPVIVAPARTQYGALPWRNPQAHVTQPAHHAQPPYIQKEIIHNPQQQRRNIPRDPLAGLWNAIGLGYE